MECFEEKTIARLAVNSPQYKFSPDGQVLATSGAKEPIRLWDVATGRPIRVFPGNASLGTAVAGFSPDGKVLASISNASRVRLWDVATGQGLRRSGGHREPVSCLAMSPDGKAVATGSSDTTLRLWEADTGKELRVLSGHQAQIAGVVFSRDGRVASADSTGTICLWETRTGKQLHTFREPLGAAKNTDLVRGQFRLIFSTDDRLLVSNPSDGAQYVWGPAMGKEVRKLTAPGRLLSAVTLSPDGKLIAAAGGVDGRADDVVYVWRTNCSAENAPWYYRCVPEIGTPGSRLAPWRSLQMGKSWPRVKGGMGAGGTGIWRFACGKLPGARRFSSWSQRA